MQITDGLSDRSYFSRYTPMINSLKNNFDSSDVILLKNQQVTALILLYTKALPLNKFNDSMISQIDDYKIFYVQKNNDTIEINASRKLLDSIVLRDDVFNFYEVNT